MHQDICTFFSVDKIREILTNHGFSIKEINYSAIPNLWIRSIQYFMKDKKYHFILFLTTEEI